MQDLKESPDGTLDLFDGDTRLSIGGEMIVRTAEDAAELRQALLEETDFDEKYEATTENFQVLTRVSQRLAKQAGMPLPDALTKSRVISAFTVADQVGGNCGALGILQKVAPAEPPARTEDGKFADRQALLRQEIKAMLADPTVHSSELHKRASIDAEFGQAWREELSGPTPATDPFKARIPSDDTGMRQKYVQFAKAWIAHKGGVRFISGYTEIGGLNYSQKELDEHLEMCSRLGIIRG